MKFEDKSYRYSKKVYSICVDESTLPQGATVEYDKQTEYVNAGKYTVTATIKKKGYKDLVLKATLTIEKAKLDRIAFEDCVFDWKENQTYSIFVQGDLPDEVKVSYTGNGQSEVGVYDVCARFDVGENYEPLQDMHATMKIRRFFTLTFDDGISTPTKRVVESGQSLSDIPSPTPKEGYAASWKRANFDNVTSDETVRARYDLISYEVLFFSEGKEIAKKTYDIESALNLDEASRNHYVFCGWFDNENFAGERVSRLEKGNFGNKVFYAKWTAVEYFVVYNLNGGKNADSNVNFEDKYKFTVESDAFDFADATRRYYDFGGWYASENFEGESIARLQKGAYGNIVLYAKWTVHKFAVRYDTAGGENNPNNPAYTTVESDEIELLEPTRKNYVFVCWQNGNGEKVEKIAAANVEEIFLTAVWKAKEFRIDCKLNGGSLDDFESTFTIEDEDVVLPVAKRVGYEFAGWFDNADFAGEKIEKVICSVAKDVEIYAKWQVITYSISYDSNGGENVENPTFYTIESEDMTLNSPQREGYDFGGWVDGEGNVVVAIKKGSVGNVALVATWTKKVLFQTDGNGQIIRYVGDDERVLEIPSEIDGEEITSVAYDVFYGMSKLETLILPSTITTMYKGMLKDCASLANLTLPFASFWIEGRLDENNVVIDDSATAFDGSMTKGASYGLTYLFSDTPIDNAQLVSEYMIKQGTKKETRKVYMPVSLKNVTVLGGDITQNAFYGCACVEYVKFLAKTNIGNLAFQNCDGLKTVEFVSSQSKLGASVFAGRTDVEIILASEDEKAEFVEINANYSNLVKVKEVAPNVYM